MTDRRLICNLWHIKQTNGLYYYALDYVRAIGAPNVVYVRATLFEAARDALKGHDVRCASAAAMFRVLSVALLQRRYIFTPTPHPLPLHRHQIVVVHDDYPFLGKSGRIKRLLFRVGLQSSDCEIGHINRTTSLDSLQRVPIRTTRLRYMPNSAPDSNVAAALRAQRAATFAGGRAALEPLRVALFGSDSPKKRYEALFSASRALRRRPVQFEVYGHATKYLRDLQATFPDMDIRLASSSEIDVSTFLKSIHAVVSVAEHEGFGRLIALALAAGIPCFLLKSPVFTEFYGRSTPLHADIAELVHALDRCESGDASQRGFEEQADIADAFDTASRHLHALARMGTRTS